MTQRILVAVVLTTCLLGSTALVPAASPEPVRIGMVSTLFNDIPPGIVQLAAGPFKMLMKEFTGLDGQLIVGGSPYEIGKKLVDKQLDLAVFHGFEYGWARQKYPELRPLTIAVSKFRQVNGFVVVKADGNIKSFADLKDKDIGFPKKSKEHCKLFMERTCVDLGQCCAKDYFHQVCASPNSDDALDDILRDKLQAVVIDNASLEEYEQFKPGCFARLKVIKQSEPFPAAVIVYREGALDDGTLKRFRDGMISANQSQRGRDMMSIFKMTAFEPIPADYGQQIAEVLRHYPAPELPENVSQK